jgi:hypothetical protein
MSQDQEPLWNPISRLPMIANFIDEMLGMAEEQYATLKPARERPHGSMTPIREKLGHFTS